MYNYFSFIIILVQLASFYEEGLQHKKCHCLKECYEVEYSVHYSTANYPAAFYYKTYGREKVFANFTLNQFL